MKTDKKTPDDIREYQSNWHKQHPESNREAVRRYRQKNHKLILERSRLSYQKNADKRRACSLKCYYNNRSHNIARSVAYHKRRNAIDPVFRVSKNLRIRVCDLLRGKCKSAKTEELLGCSFENFKIYLESKWESGMSWENYGYYGWHVDHIIPCALFDLSKPDHQKRCFHFSNLQPMWAHDNLSKQHRIT